MEGNYKSSQHVSIIYTKKEKQFAAAKLEHLSMRLGKKRRTKENKKKI
jgi:hypothetical protein